MDYHRIRYKKSTMGNITSKIRPFKYQKILILGNHGVGKSTILNNLLSEINENKNSQIEQKTRNIEKESNNKDSSIIKSSNVSNSSEINANFIRPTHFFETIKISHLSINSNIWDISGSPFMQDLWSCYFSGTDGVIFVINAKNLLFELQILKKVIKDFTEPNSNTIKSENAFYKWLSGNKKVCMLVIVTSLDYNHYTNIDKLCSSSSNNSKVNLSMHNLKKQKNSYNIEFKDQNTPNSISQIHGFQDFNKIKSQISKVLLNKVIFNIIKDDYIRGFEWLLNSITLY